MGLVRKNKKNNAGFTLTPKFSVTCRRQGGFTLVELLVVISIIGILSSLATVSVNVARIRARDAVRKSDIAQVKLALFLYYDDNLSYPSTGSVLPEDITEENWQDVLIPSLDGTLSGKVYMARPPLDPLNTGMTIYKYGSNGKEFVIHYYLEQGGFQEVHEYY